MKVRIWGAPGDSAQTVRINIAVLELPEDAALVRLFVKIPELSSQEHYGEAEVYTAGQTEISIICQCDEEPISWDEFNPKMYDLECHGDVVRAVSEDDSIYEKRSIAFSEFRPIGTQFSESGRSVFIRGVMAGDRSLENINDIFYELKNIKKRGLNCISVSADAITDELLEAADIEGIYIKAEGDKGYDKWASLEHPSLVMVGDALGSYADANIPWMEFAVRDRQDYSDAPDTKSDHREDVYGQGYPTLLTHVGEWRKGATKNTEAAEYLAQICCREEMEAALRTPQFGGYILQSDAGVMKMPAKHMREFAGPVVPLLMMKKYVWSTDEQFVASVLIANYSDKKFFERISVTATDEQGQRYTKMSNRIRINKSSLVGTGEVAIPLEQFTPGQSIEIQVSIDDTEYRNHYTIWLFSDNISIKVPPHVHVTRKLDDRTKVLLENGKKVIFIPKLNRLPYEPGWFSPLASQAAAHREKVVSGGITCDIDHPIMRKFPTERIGDFQWWHLIHNSTPIPVSGKLAENCILEVEDNGCKKAYLGECRVGQGKLIYSSIDLLIQMDRVEARQLYANILSYVASDAFNPKVEISYDELEKMTQED